MRYEYFHIPPKNKSNLKDESTSSQDFISSGFPEFDSRVGPFIKGSINVLAGRPAIGKTYFLIHMALKMSVENRVMFFSFTESLKTLSKKFALISLGKNYFYSTRPLIGEQNEEFNPINDNALENPNLFLGSEYASPFDDWLMLMEQEVDQLGINVVFLDGLYISDEFTLEGCLDVRLNEMIIRMLHQWACRKNIILILSWGVSPKVEIDSSNHQPLLRHLKNKSGLIKLADKIIFLFRYDYYEIDYDETGTSTKNISLVKVLQNKFGPVFNIQFYHDTSKSTLESMGDRENYVY